jgi:hypothetical protein
VSGTAPSIGVARVQSFGIAILCLLAFALAVAAGLVTTNRLAIFLILGTTACIWVVLLSTNWRWATFMLLIVLPFSGLPTLILRQPGWPSQLKEVLFIVPAYLGAFLVARRERLHWVLPKPLAVFLIALVLVVIMQVGPVLVASPLVALVGLKVWLFYVPLILLPQHLFRTMDEVIRWIRGLVALALIPAVIGLAEAALIYSGSATTVYNLYGSLAPDVTQSFATVGVAHDINLVRITSTFTFATQYYGLLFSMLPLAVGIWLGDPRRGWRTFGGVATLILGIAGVVSGARGFLVWLPVQVALILWLVGRRRLLLALTAVVAGGLTAFASLVAGVYEVLGDLVNVYLFGVSSFQMQTVVKQVGLVGAGVGSDSGATRYVLDPALYAGGVEIWYGKVLFELGAVGLLAVVLLWLAILSILWRIRLRLRRGPLFVMGTVLFVFALTTMLNLIKGPMIDLDPQNVYFWFFIGLALTLPSLARSMPQAEWENHPPPVASAMGRMLHGT